MEIVSAEIPMPSALKRGVHAVYRSVLLGEPDDCFIGSTGENKRIFVATVDQEVVGFKFGAEKRPSVFHSRMGAVGTAHRRLGVARALLEAQHAWARAEGYQRIHTETLNVFRPMLLLNLAAGFEIVGSRCVGKGEPLLQLVKNLDLALVAPTEAVVASTAEVHYRLADLPFDPSVRAGVERLHREAFAEEGDWVYRYLEVLPAATCWLAESDGKIVGLKMGACKGPTYYHSHEGAVAKAFRRRGIARALMEKQHAWATEHGYHAITTHTFGRFVGMLRLNLEMGFDLVGTSMKHGDQWPKLQLAKRLDGKPGFGPETYISPG